MPAPLWLILSAMLAGLVLGLCGQTRIPVEERLLDGALVLSGQVSFPEQAVMGLYYKGVWTLLYQLGALVLRAGASYPAANLIFLLMPPAILTGAFALFLHGLTGRPLFSLAMAILCFMNGYVVSLLGSSDYPLLGMAWNTPSEYSNGRFGAALAAFSFAALVGGRNALAAFTAACLVAIHPVIGAYTVTMVAFGLFLGRVLWRRAIAPSVLAGFAAGLAVTLASLAAFLVMRPYMPAVDEAANRPFLEAYLSLWDYHRNRLPTHGDYYRVAASFSVLTAPLLLFLVLRRGRRASADTGVLVLIAATVLSTVLYVLAHAAASLLPEIVLRAIPGRLINMQVSFAVPLVVGMVVFLADEIARRLQIRRGSGAVLFRFPNAIAIAVVVVLAVRFVPGFAYALAITPGDPAVAAAQAELAEIDSPFWAKVRALEIDRLVLVPASLSLKALRYGRLPLALDASEIDFVPYLPQTASAVGRLIERAYGLSFFDPPVALRFHGVLPPDAGRAYWACLSPGQWFEIAQQFGISDLLVPAGWPVRLPVVLADDKYALHALPSRKPDSVTAPPAPAEPPCPVLRN